MVTAETTKTTGNQLAAALVAVGYQEPKEVPNGTLHLKEGQNLCLMFDCPIETLPEGVKIMPAGAGSACIKNPTDNFQITDVKIDLDGLLSRCSVQSFIVCKGVYKRSVRVYMNAVVQAGKSNKVALASNRALLCRIVKNTFSVITIRSTGTHLSIILGKPAEGVNGKKIRFAIKKSETDSIH